MAVDRISRAKPKVCIVGDRGVGNSSLVNRYIFDHFSDEYRGTRGSILHFVKIQETVEGGHLFNVEVAVFDLMGETGIRDNFREIMFGGTRDPRAERPVLLPPPADGKGGAGIGAADPRRRGRRVPGLKLSRTTGRGTFASACLGPR